MKINILSGDAMADYADTLGFKGNPICFSEAMITGNTTEKIFDDEFVKERASALGTTPEKYRKKIVFPLSKLRTNDEVHVWFGADLFCQLNLITLLARLESIGISEVTYHVVNEDEMKETECQFVKTQGFTEIYKAILILHETASCELSTVNDAQLLFSDYLDENGRLASFIKENKDDSVFALTVKIIKTFPQYGLGDVQCANLIKAIREKTVSEV